MANCWKCGRYLGVKDEWKKMNTEREIYATYVTTKQKNQQKNKSRKIWIK